MASGAVEPPPATGGSDRDLRVQDMFTFSFGQESKVRMGSISKSPHRSILHTHLGEWGEGNTQTDIEGERPVTSCTAHPQPAKRLPYVLASYVCNIHPITRGLEVGKFFYYTFMSAPEIVNRQNPGTRYCCNRGRDAESHMKSVLIGHQKLRRRCTDTPCSLVGSWSCLSNAADVSCDQPSAYAVRLIKLTHSTGGSINLNTRLSFKFPFLSHNALPLQMIWRVW